jgi:hypothetical protein
MKKAAVIFNWIALVWTTFGFLGMITSPEKDFWSFVYLGIILAAQVLALKIIR